MTPALATAAAFALALQGGPSAAVPEAAPLSLEQRMLLRCSAAFALVARRQADGEADALALPPLAETGREFFVRAAARVMDETGLDRAGIAAAIEEQARQLAEGALLAATLPPCLALLPEG